MEIKNIERKLKKFIKKKISYIINFYSFRMASMSKKLNKTTLNKLLFYTDFGNFKKTGYSITGITYRAI